MKKQVFQGLDFNGNAVAKVDAIEILSNASTPSHAVRLSQTQQIAADAVQAKLVDAPELASSDTAFTSSTMANFLSGKQDNMEIESSSAAYMEIVDGYKIKVKQLLISDVEVDETYGTLASYIAGVSPSKQQGDVVILNAAVNNQERTWIKTGAASQNVDGYTRLQTDYNVSSIRAMLSAGAYMNYSASTGQFSVDLGTASHELGAHNLPVSSSEFDTVSGSNILEIAKSLEALINTGQQTQQQQTQTVDTRISSCTGVSGSNLGNFGGRFSNDSTIKAVLQEAETEIANSELANSTLRQDMNAADAALQGNIDAANNSRVSGDAGVSSASIARDNTLQTNIDNTNYALSSEASARLSADNALDSRLSIVEGSSTTTGSIAKAQADANSHTHFHVDAEAATRSAADANLQTQIDSISDAFHYKGYINADGRIVHIDPTHANNNALFETATLANGDFYKVNAAITITFGDSSTIEGEAGDGLLVINDVASGSSSASDIHKTDNTEAADLLREGMLDGTTIEKASGTIKIVANSVGRTQLSADVEANIDSKVEKAGDTMTGALAINKVVTAGIGHTGGYSYAAHIKMKSVDTDSLTDTQRSLLVENEAYTNGSGNAMELDFTNAATVSSNYKGSSQDMTLALTGLYGEVRVASPAAAVYATGVYGVAMDSQLGLNAGGTFIAQNAATSNLGIFAFSDTAGAANNRSAYFALAPDSLDFAGYRVARVNNPLSVQDAAVVIDDYTGTKHALFVSGKSEFDGKVIVPSSTADNEAVNGADIKAKQKIYTFNLLDGVDKVISTPTSMNLNKTMWREVGNNTAVGLYVNLDNDSKTITVRATGGSPTGITLLLQELSCEIEAV